MTMAAGFDLDTDIDQLLKAIEAGRNYAARGIAIDLDLITQKIEMLCRTALVEPDANRAAVAAKLSMLLQRIDDLGLVIDSARSGLADQIAPPSAPPPALSSAMMAAVSALSDEQPTAETTEPVPQTKRALKAYRRETGSGVTPAGAAGSTRR